MVQYLLNLSCCLVLINSTLVIVSRNALHSILFLILTFLFSSLIVFLLNNEFLALFFIIIYLGAIVVLFLFVVMMLDLKLYNVKLTRPNHIVGFLFGSFLICVFLNILKKTFSKTEELLMYDAWIDWYKLVDCLPDVEALGLVLYNFFSTEILITGLLLYVTILGVSFLTVKKYKNLDSKKQRISKQLSRNLL